MKMFSGTIGLLCLACTVSAQHKATVFAKSVNLDPQHIWVSYQKTTSLIFSSPIRSVDRGSTDILVQKAEGVDNVLKLKAGRHRFEETNLSVITADGNIYPFNVSYSSNPQTSTMMIRTPAAAPATGTMNAGKVTFSETGLNDAILRKLAAQASITRSNIDGIGDKSYGMELTLSGLYTASDHFYYKLVIRNHTNVSYDIGAVNFYIRDRKKVKRVATQEIVMEPVMLIGSHRPVAAHATAIVIAVMPKQTIAADKKLVIEIEEDKGGRNLNASVKNSVLLKAAPIVVTPAVDNIPNVLNAAN